MNNTSLEDEPNANGATDATGPSSAAARSGATPAASDSTVPASAMDEAQPKRDVSPADDAEAGRLGGKGGGKKRFGRRRAGEDKA